MVVEVLVAVVVDDVTDVDVFVQEEVVVYVVLVLEVTDDVRVVDVVEVNV